MYFHAYSPKTDDPIFFYRSVRTALMYTELSFSLKQPAIASLFRTTSIDRKLVENRFHCRRQSGVLVWLHTDISALLRLLLLGN